ncbi:hypothetical protein [Sphingobacterium endophyticum]|uniref:hypothetical protein n=1 Tax=Sphingobacterium endophyticum TaxID=2546448 RepID=UPI0012E2925A|nr:hypothetical protein [Sphingobacterium endophyticum]
MLKEEYNNTLRDFFRKVPNIDLAYIKSLTNRTGILQHAKFNIPDYHHGYCLDDNSRALLLILMASQELDEPIQDDLISTYLSYIFYSQTESGYFINFMGYDLKFLETIGSEDSIGRTIWSLGYLIGHHKFKKFHAIAKEMFDKAINHVINFKSIRAISYSVLGILYFLNTYPNQQSQLNQINKLLSFLEDEFNAAAEDNWHWFEEIISYDNAIIPLSLLRAGRFFNIERFKNIGIKSAKFLDNILFKNNYLSLIGNENWLAKNSNFSNVGQQPIEVSSIILLNKELFLITSENEYLEKIKLSFLWFLGINDHNYCLFNFENMACYDGLEPYGINGNMGAESNIAFWISYIHVKNVL